MKRFTLLLGLMVILVVLAACGPQATPEVRVEEKVVEKTVVVEKEVVKEVVKVVTPTPAPTKPPEPKTYRMGIFEDMTTTNYWAYLDPEASVWNAYVLGNMHPALYTLAYPTIQLVPSLATEMPEPAVQEGDFWVTTTTIRQGVQWSDGEELTVEDLVFAFEVVRDFGLGGNWLSIFDLDFIDRIEAVDDYTVKIYYKQQPGLAVWPHGVGLAPFMPKHFWESAVEECRGSDDPATCLYAKDGSGEPSAGPFIFKKWEPGAFAEIVANDNYYWKGTKATFYANQAYQEKLEGKYEFCVYGDCTGDVDLEYETGPFIPNVIYSIYGTQDAAVLALRDGEVDFLLNPLGLQRGLREQVVGQPGLAAIQNPSNGFRYLAFNMRKPPNDILEFRQAIAYLIDKEYITQNVLQGTAIPIYAMVPEGNAFWYNPDVPKLGQGMSREERINKVIELLTSAGFSWEQPPAWDADNGVVIPASRLIMPNGEPVPEIELLAPSAGYDPMRATAAIWIAQWANEVGIPVKANPTGFNTIIPKVFDEVDFDWYILGWGLGNPALPDFHEAFFHSANDALEGGFNTPGYNNPEFDALADAMKAATDLEEARKLVWEMDAMLAEEVPYVVLFTAPILEFYAKDRVKYPFTETLDGLQNLNGMPDLVQTF